MCPSAAKKPEIREREGRDRTTDRDPVRAPRHRPACPARRAPGRAARDWLCLQWKSHLNLEQTGRVVEGLNFDGINGITKFSKLAEFPKGSFLDRINKINTIGIHGSRRTPGGGAFFGWPGLLCCPGVCAKRPRVHEASIYFTGP